MKDWSRQLLGDVCHIIGGGTPSKRNKAFYGGNIPWATVRDMKDELLSRTDRSITAEAVDSSSTNLIPGGNVVIATRVGLGKVCLLRRDMAINQDLRAIIPKQADQVDVRFLFRWFQSIAPIIERAGKGLTVKGVSLPFLKSLSLPLPPLPEQKRIVSILDEGLAAIDAVTANIKKNLANSRELFESRSQALFARKSAEWESVQLSELLARRWILSHQDGNHGNAYPRKSEFTETGVPYISANCLKRDRVDMTLVKYLAAGHAAQLHKGFAENGDVVFAHNATVGPVAVLRTDERFVILSTSLTLYRTNQEYLIPEYLAHYMRSPAFILQYQNVMRQSTRNQVPITKQREFYHVVPPVAEQRAIATELDHLSGEFKRLGDIYDAKLTSMAELKRSLLTLAFTGELTANEAVEQAAVA
jgi:type I restriction enzyme, S subunit